jgi:hypothetical protein
VLLLSAGPGHAVTALAAGTLRNLARNNQANRDALREAGGIAPLCALLTSGEPGGANSPRADQEEAGGLVAEIASAH